MGPNRDLVDVVPIRIGGTVIIRRVAEREGAADSVYDKVAAVAARHRPLGEDRAIVLGISGRIGPQLLGNVIVLGNGEGAPARDHRPLGLVRDGDDSVNDVPQAPLIGGHYRDLVHIVPVGVHRDFKVRQQAQGEDAVVDGKALPVGALHRPRDCVVIVLVRGPVGVHDRGGVLPHGELGPALCGDDRRLVHLPDRHYQRYFQHAVGPAVGGPHRHLVDIVPVRVGRPLVVRRGPEPQFAQFADDEVAAVAARSAPPEDTGAGIFRVCGRVIGQHSGVGMVLGNAAGCSALQSYLRAFVDVGDGNSEGQAVRIAVLIGGHDLQFVFVVPVVIGGILKVWWAREGQGAGVGEGECCGVVAAQRPGNEIPLRVAGTERIDRRRAVLAES